MSFRAEPLPLTSFAVLGQLFVHGPMRSVDLVSQAGFQKLVDLGYAYRRDELAGLTDEGMALATEWRHKELHPALEGWFQKQKARLRLGRLLPGVFGNDPVALPAPVKVSLPVVSVSRKGVGGNHPAGRHSNDEGGQDGQGDKDSGLQDR